MNIKYPHDRIVFFSDAVFAIAITLLVIEIKVPGHDVIHNIGMATALQRLIPLFIGFFVSFLVTGLFWKSHLQLCTLIIKFDSKLIWINTLLLLFVALMPFSTALYSENFGSNVAFAFYCLNVAMIGLFHFWMTFTVISRAEFTGDVNTNWMKVRALVVPIVFLVCIGLAFINPMLSRVAFVLIFVIQAIGDRISKRKIQVT